MSITPEAAAPTAPPTSLSPLARFVAIFVRPAAAWGGLESRHQWWFPLAIMLVVQVVVMVLLYERAYLPMYFEQLDAQIASGAIEPGHAQRAEQMMQSPVMRYVISGLAGVSSVLVTLVMAVVMWFGVSFILGTRFRYRLALEVTAWTGLVWLPQQIAFFALAWAQETMKGIHFGLAVLLPEADPPARWHTGLAVLLDALGPFNIWYVAVAVVGCSALSGAPRRSVAWVLGGLAVALAVVSALVAALFSPAS